jgi:PAS domain S-box-containing protein
MNQNQILNILLIEDNPGDARLLKELLKERSSNDSTVHQFKLIRAENLSAGLAKLQESNIDVLLLDLSLPDSTGLDTFYRTYREASHIPIIVLSGFKDESVAVQAVREGAQDYLFKGEVNGDLLLRAIRYAIERKRIVDVSQQERDLIDALMNNLPDTIYFKDRQSCFIRINKAQAEVLGIDNPDEAVGKTDFDYFPKEQAQKAFANEQKLIKTDRPLISKVEKIERADGQIRWVTSTKVPMRNKYNQITGIISVSRDITEEKRSRGQLEKTAKELEETANQLKRVNAEQEQFAYVAFHDLQEPLRIVASCVQLLEKRYQKKLGTDADEYIHYAVDASKRMKRLLNDLLIYSRLGGHSRVIEEVDCRYILSVVLGNLKEEISENKAKINYCDTIPKVTGDGQHLMRLFSNLIDNAIKFRSEAKPMIDIQVQQKNGDWLFSIKDNGIGFDNKYADRIFMIFKRLHNWERYPGTGIGLAMCKKIVEFHGGKIWAESELGKGSTFYFTLPHENS